MEDNAPTVGVMEEIITEAATIVEEMVESWSSTTASTEAEAACEIFPALILPTPLEPLFSTPNTLISPLFVLAVAMMLLSLLFAQKFNRSPLQQLGQVGHRGRRYHSWNESTTGGCGGRFIDWWIFGGSVWIRAALCLWDGMAGTHSLDHHHHHICRELASL